jgi:hypothetical protein
MRFLSGGWAERRAQVKSDWLEYSSMAGGGARADSDAYQITESSLPHLPSLGRAAKGPLLLESDDWLAFSQF